MSEPEQMLPVWDRHGVRWSYVETEEAWVCDDPDYEGPPVIEPGAIPADRQPHYAHPPNEIQQAMTELRPDER